MCTVVLSGDCGKCKEEGGTEEEEKFVSDCGSG